MVVFLFLLNVLCFVVNAYIGLTEYNTLCMLVSAFNLAAAVLLLSDMIGGIKMIHKEALTLSSRWLIQQIKVWYKTRFIHLYKGCYEIIKSVLYIIWSLTLLLLSPIIVIYLSFSLFNNYKELVSKYNKTGRESIERHLNRSEGFIMKRIVKIINGDKK